MTKKQTESQLPVAVTTWTYKGADIRFTDRADFMTRHHGQTLRAASLDALKKKIDAAFLFEPFDAYFQESGYRGDRYPKEKVAAKSRRYSNFSDSKLFLLKCRIVNFDRVNSQFVDEDGNRHKWVYRATPEALAAWIGQRDVDRRRAAAEAAFAKEESALEKQMVTVDAKKYGQEN